MSTLSLVLRTLEILRETGERREPGGVDAPVQQRLCWHCCHPWRGESLKFPVSKDDRLKKFRVVGQFCSWECIKGYNRDNYANIRNSIQDVNIRYYRKMMTGNVIPVPAAPPRSFLTAFGGKMNIDENPNTPSKFGVRAIPTLVLFKDGKRLDQRGSQSAAQIKALIESAL